jgi:hypothetical protein
MDDEKISQTQRDMAYQDTRKDDPYFNRTNGEREAPKKAGNLPGILGREISAYHKHFKRLIENLGEE